MDVTLSPRASGKFISERSKHAYVVKENVGKAANTLLARMLELKYSEKTWKTHELHPKQLSDATVNWIFVVDCLNFSFWVEKGQEPFMVEFHGKLYDDYEALCALVNRALEENIAITSPNYLKDISLDDAKAIFRSATSTQIPLIEKRVEHLREAGTILSTKYEGSVVNLISSCKYSAVKLVKAIVSQFSSFRDEGIYDSRRVSFYKRAQIFVADVWACFEGQGPGRFDDITELTMFADYRVPQCLQYLGVLNYSEDLRQRIEREDKISPGSAEEMEIRGCSIHAVECLREAIEEQHDVTSNCNGIRKLNSVIIDFYLWDFATLNSDQMEKYPEHRTRTQFY